MIGTLLEKLLVVVGVDVSDLGSGLNGASKEIDRAADGMKRSLEDVGKSWRQSGQRMIQSGAVMSAAVTAPLVLFGNHAVKAASDAQEMQSAFEVVFGEMVTDVRAWAEATGDAMGRSTQEMQRGALAFQELFGKALDPAQAAEMSKTFAVLTQDLASFKNLSNEVAQQKLFSGLTGEAEPLRAVGVFLNEAAVEAKLLELGIQGVNGKFTDQEKIIGRAALIQEQLAAANGDVLRTSDSLANKQRAAQAAYEELSVTVGEVLIPAITPLVEMLADLLLSFNQLDPGLQTFIVGTAATAAVVGPLVIGIGGLVSGIGLLIPLFGALPALISTIGLAFNTLLLSPLGLIVVAIGAVVAAWYYWDEIVAIVNRVGAAVSEWWSRTIKPITDAVKGAFSAMVDSATGSISRLYHGVRQWLQDRLGAVFDWLKGKLKAVGGYFFDLYDAVVGNSYIPDMVDGIGQNMARLQALMVDPAIAATRRTGDAFRNLTSDVAGLLDQLFPVQAQLRKIFEDMATLEKGRAAGLLDPATYDAARAKLVDERIALRRDASGPLPVTVAEQTEPLTIAMLELSEVLIDLPRVATDAEIALSDFGHRLGNDIMSGIAAVLTGRGSLKDVIRDLFSRFLEDVILSSLSSLEKAVFGEDGLGGFLGGFLSSVIGGRAVGGPVVPGRAYTVGSGEIFQPSQSGRILSRNDAMRALGGNSGGIGRIAVTVSGARGNQEIMEMVREGVKEGIGQYDRVVGERVDSSFKRRG